MKGQDMNVRTYLMLLMACAGLGAMTGVVQSQDLPSILCPPSENPAPAGSGLIWVFN
jgi:hypothetical protein